jgi:hypothetical protein
MPGAPGRQGTGAVPNGCHHSVGHFEDLGSPAGHPNCQVRAKCATPPGARLGRRRKGEELDQAKAIQVLDGSPKRFGVRVGPRAKRERDRGWFAGQLLEYLASGAVPEDERQRILALRNRGCPSPPLHDSIHVISHINNKRSTLGP